MKCWLAKRSHAAGERSRPASILWKHGLKNVSVPLFTVTGLLINRLLGATVVIEAVFAIPGTGSLVVNAAIGKDFPVVQGVVLTMVVLVIVVNLVSTGSTRCSIPGYRGHEPRTSARRPLARVLTLAAGRSRGRRSASGSC